LEFRVLGPLQVVDAGEVVALGSAQQRAVLALLILHAPEPVSLDRLIDELWGERPPATAQHAVQVYVSGIRKLLRVGGADVAVRTSASGYALDVDPGRIDAGRFERLLAESQRVLAGDPSHARTLFEEALALWRGPALADFQQSEITRHQAARLEELRTLAIEGLVEARLACGEHAEVIGPITGLVAVDPLRERPRRLLMLALYRSGRHPEALAVYRDACEVLDEIGLQPGPQLRQLEQAILCHDTSLGAPSLVADVRADPGAAGARPSAGASRPAHADGSPPGNVAAIEPVDAAAPRKTRKVVTALFCDVTGSTALGEELDPELLHGVLNRYFKELRATIERHGGTVDKFIGDAVTAVFGIPRVREDDALRAVRAAAEIRERLPAVAEEVGVALSFRTGVSTGPVFASEGENLAIGDAVNIAARLEQAAAPGEILLGEETLRLVRDAVEVEPVEPIALKGKSTPVRAFRLVAVDPIAPGLARHLERPLVGRERELGLLRAGWDRTVQEAGCHLFTLLGAAGVGKSRLVSELLATVGDAATVLTGRCLHYGEGITFWPLVEALTPAGERAEPVLERLRGGGAATPEELFWEVRRLLESLALERPVIVHVDDLQWAEPMLLDLLDHVVDLSRGAPILVLCTARTELLEDRSGWGGGKLNATALLLQPLGAAESEALLDRLGDRLAPEARARVIAASEGNPLFLEEMAALARERTTVTVPSTIQALLAARLDSLPVQERELLEHAAIEGEVFHRTAVRAFAAERLDAEFESRLAGLVRKELIRPHRPTLYGGDAFRFRHLLIRDAAYDGMPKAIRAELHERFASWLQDNVRELAELDELTGWHLEQAVRYQHQLGRDINPALTRRAAEHLHAAGRRARERSDTASATNLLERAHALVPEENALRAWIGIDLAEQLIEAGELTRADELLSTAERDPDTTALAALIRFEFLLRARPQEFTQTSQSTLPGIIERLSREGDERGLARAHMAAFNVHWLQALATSAGEEALLAAEHARNAGDEGLRSRALGWYVATLTLGPQDAQTIKEKLDAIEREDPGPYLATRVGLARGQLERLAGHFPGARQLVEHAIESYLALGMPMNAAATHMYLAEIELSDGNAAEALLLLLRGDTILAKAREHSMRSTIQGDLSRVYERLGDRDGARAAIALSDQLGVTDDVIPGSVTHAVRARLALQEGDAEAAERWARSAVEHAFRTDFVVDQANAQLELARILAALGRHADATSEAHTALGLYEAKGDRPGAAETQALLDHLSVGA
jgi:class 3 adenylate cyclase/DNA-binding winged helix-turn-helix (wHTH) protein/tetratricopeptide (TPR) repeat protein